MLSRKDFPAHKFEQVKNKPTTAIQHYWDLRPDEYFKCSVCGLSTVQPDRANNPETRTLCRSKNV